MLDLNKLENYYFRLYKEMRNYIWDFHTVECLADLEVSIYFRFPNINEIRRTFYKLSSCIYPLCFEDEDLKKARDEFESLINSTDKIFSRLHSVMEV